MSDYATFNRRKTPVPAKTPLTLTPEFGTDKAKISRWKAFLKKGKLEAGKIEMVQVCEYLAEFLVPPALAIVKGKKFAESWIAGGQWVAES